ncbi:S49 family peptidase [Sphingobacterium spiritivorum]|uniref:S49 family peptidase n=1 Tax=Sphingobacterium spiritivorum TaxID=258 RepID=UPI003DA50B10
MSNFRLISAIRRGIWLLEDNWADDNLHIAYSILDGKSIANDSLVEHAIKEKTLTSYSNMNGWDDAPKDSIAVHYILGPVLHYGVCGPGTYNHHMRFKEADSNRNIIGHLFVMDTPGGEAAGIKEYGESIKKSKKPKVGFINSGMIASAGVWIAAGLDAIYASSELCEVGSIGAYSTLYDLSEYDKKTGIKRIVIRARQSPDKNLIYDEAIAGDPKAIKVFEDRISMYAGSFIDWVQECRGDRLTSDEWNTGKMYMAKEAISLGLIDGIATFEEVVSLISSPNSNLKTQKKDMNKFQNVAALSDKTSVTQEELDLANADLTAAGITSFTLVEQSVIDEGARVTQELATANADLETANATIAANVIVLEQNKAEITQLKNVIAKRAAADNGIKTKADATKEAEIKSGDDKKVSAHNQAADKSFF